MAFQSEQIISAASQRYGVIDYSRWQAIRWQWYSYVTYPLAGASELNFFGNVAGQVGVTLQDTNMTKAGSFGQTHFQLKSISTDIRIANDANDGFTAANIATLDQHTTASDFLNGFVQAGVLTFNIGARPFATIPKPFQYAPPSGSPLDFENSHANQITAAPSVASIQVVGLPQVAQTSLRSNVYFVDPNILIEAEQQFNVNISFPSGAVPVLATQVTNIPVANGNPYKIGIILDGLLLRPMQ